MNRKSLVVFSFLLFLFGVRTSSQSITNLAFDIPSAEVGLILHYEYKLDAAPFTQMSVTQVQLEDTPADHVSFQFPLQIPRGDHILTVRACTDVGCTDPSNVLSIKLVGAPNNLRPKK